MININVNVNNLEYDIYTLFKSFYSNEELNILCTEKTGNDFSGFSICIYDDTVCCDIYKNGLADKSFTEKYFSDSTSEHELNNAIQKSNMKNAMKRVIYRCLSEITNSTLPWGTLTGIRPTKLPMKMLTENKSDVEISDFLKDTYYVSDEKIELSINIAKREKKILEEIDAVSGYSLYIGIPFCPTTCLYCSFTSYAISLWSKRVDEYIECLKKEIDYVSEQFSNRTLDTIYIGGGTPTTLQPYQFEELIGYIKEKLDLSSLKEFTVEAGRPDSINEEKLLTLKKLGVTRISINPQTMNDETLKIIGRNHSVLDVKKAFQLARSCSFDNINMDLILGLPGEDYEMVKKTMEEIAFLNPDSITVHSMAIKRAANMQRFLDAHPEIKSENSPEMMDCAAAYANNLGMKPYYLYRQKNMAGNFENTGFARENKFGIYNILIMEEVQIIVACGAGTVTKRVYPDGRIERCDNVKDVGLYIEKIDEMIERKRNLFSTIECRHSIV